MKRICYDPADSEVQNLSASSTTGIASLLSEEKDVGSIPGVVSATCVHGWSTQDT